MATLITKNSSTTTSVPSASQLVQGELAVNVTDKRLFTENSGGSVVELGTNPSSLTLSSGTANGVAYLNGAKAVTSGSALVFDGTNLGVGTASPGYKLDVAGTGAFTAVRATGSTGGTPFLTQYGSGGNWQFGQNVGGGGTDDNFSFYSSTLGAVVMRLDSSGNLGLGVTPSAWFSSYKAFQVNTNGSLTSNTDFFAVSNNAFVNAAGNDIYLTTGFAGRYRHVASNGAHQWYTAPSGTAGAAITFTQAMTLDASGNLGVGATSISQSLQIDKTAASIYINSTGQGTSSLFFAGTSGSASLTQFGGELRFNTGGTANTAGTGVTERMRLDSAGNLGIGTSSPNTKLELRKDTTTAGSEANIFLNNRVAGTTPYYSGGLFGGGFRDIRDPAYIAGIDFYRDSAVGGVASAGSIRFYTDGDGENLADLRANCEKMRLDSSGNLMVGATSGIGSARISTVATGVSIGTSGTAGNYRQIYWDTGSSNLYFYNGTNQGYLNSAGAWVSASDARLKKDIVDIEYGLSTVLLSKPRSYNRVDVSGKYIGFIAQELQSVIPEVVSGDPEKQLGVEYGALVAVAFKAIQEQQAMIEELKTRLAAAGI